ncbi:MAG: hypothetical protein JSS02_08295 [Planctomycetes bacterium]|nr:hypothetical protein [Planctomycetota bacterium]
MMNDRSRPTPDLRSRRTFLREASLLAAGAWVAPFRSSSAAQIQAGGAPRPKIAAVITACFYRSHGHVILENFLEPYLFNGRLLKSPVDVVSIYLDQTGANDTGLQIARDYQIPVYKTIDAALCRGGQDLAVDGVLIIGEHGEYPTNSLGQVEYPRKRLFDESVKVMVRSERFVPIFNDKHLSYRWDWAKEMYDTARQHGIPFMAGSSVPLAERRPPLELPPGAEIEEIVSVHGGPVESYDFHGLEVLESLAEGRKGGETGISGVELLTGDAMFKAADAGRWSFELAEAALAAEQAVRKVPLRELIRSPARAILLNYKDGLKGASVSIGYSGVRWCAAYKLKNDPQIYSTYFYGGPWNNRGLFRALSHAIQELFVTRKTPYPVERTLLTTGLVDAAMHSLAAGGKLQPTPHLEFAYPTVDFRAFREMGKTWQTITPDTPEPKGLKRDPEPRV